MHKGIPLRLVPIYYPQSRALVRDTQEMPNPLRYFRLCRFVSELTVGGDKVTDEGMRNLVGHLDLDPIPDDDEDESDDGGGGRGSSDFSPADICSSLIHFKLLRAYRVTTVGMTIILKRFRRLESFECAEETFWAAMEHDDELNSASYRLPLKEIMPRIVSLGF